MPKSVVELDLGTLTKNEQTVTEIYAVDDMLHVDHAGVVQPTAHLSPAMAKTLEIGSICNNAIWREEDQGYVGQATDVALLNVLPTFGMTDQRNVGIL